MIDPKFKNQRQGKFASAAAAAKDKGKGQAKSGPAPSYLPVRQEQRSDSGSEYGYASIAMVQPWRPPLRIDYRAMNAHCCKDTLKGDWAKAQPANGV